MPESVLVTGASSQLGVFLLPRLQQAGFRVLAFSRRCPSAGFDASGQVRWQPPGPIGDDWAGARRLVSCGPLGLAHDLVVKQGGLRRVVAFSTSSVLTKSGSANRVEREQMAKIQEQESRLIKGCENRGISLLLLRPTLIYGCGLDRNISMLARFGRKFGFIPLAGQAAGLRQPVHADDLAALAVRALRIDRAISMESVACGGSTLTYREMVEKIAACCGAGVSTPPLPPWLLGAIVQAASIVPSFRNMNIEMVRRQSRDMVFDDTALRNTIHYEPRSFEPGRADFEIPEAALQHQLPA